ncbi:hypothetical protein [Hyphomicrobium sp.]|uniref:hypothetical protein n=1 Tax=Hyphomicrobium sp. TaxID=82 RepID=UPI0025BCAD7B|nr:hypothetical protein [Hyphomicrobium sp.]MCC7251044.1 hypothetical protein [Hyphomicrobium sp.]
MLLVANAAISLAAIRTNFLSWHFASLFSYQVDKLEGASPIGVLFVGDSSLGNAIDARQWQDATGSVVINAALTGVYGYEGSLEMLRRAVDTRGVQTVVIMQTPDMMMRPDSYESLLFSASSLSSLKDVPPFTLVSWLLSKEIPLSAWRRLRRGTHPIKEKMREWDYIPQGAPENTRAKFPQLVPFSAASINPGKTDSLVRLARYCAEHGLRCLYAHGPVAEPLCSDKGGYYSQVNAIIRSTGLDLVSDTPICLTRNEIGDSLDHVSPELRRTISTRYFDLIMRPQREGG